ncbi:MAG TPA: 3'-5' exonuclease [Casimicrobiaceae bacterium]|nr:3'-5' exonuclease [Casimicrobiaceae bacterium]
MTWRPWPRRRGAEATRAVVLDVEATGLDAERDDLLAIATVGVELSGSRVVVRPADSFEVVLQHDTGESPDKSNILLHGIGAGAQRAGVDAAEALASFAGHAGAAYLVGFHVAFDRRMIERALDAARRPRLPNRWLDLADLAPVLHPGTNAKALDDWLSLYGIKVAQRHVAASDAWATAELLQRLWSRAFAQGLRDWRALEKMAAARRWLPGA